MHLHVERLHLLEATCVWAALQAAVADCRMLADLGHGPTPVAARVRARRLPALRPAGGGALAIVRALVRRMPAAALTLVPAPAIPRRPPLKVVALAAVEPDVAVVPVVAVLPIRAGVPVVAVVSLVTRVPFVTV